MSIRRMTGVLVSIGLALTVSAAPAAAAGVPNPCTVLKVPDLTKVLGTTPAAGVRGAREISSTSCSYAVPAGQGRPAGEIIVTVTFSSAKATYQRLAQDTRYTTFSEGAAKGLYAPNPLGVAQVLKKSKMLSIQGVFVDTTARPVVTLDVKRELTVLAAIGVKRL